LKRTPTNVHCHDTAKFLRLTLLKVDYTHDRENIGVVWNEVGLKPFVGSRGLMGLKVVSSAYRGAAVLLSLAGMVTIGRRRGLVALLLQPAVLHWGYFLVRHGVTVAGDRCHDPSVPAIAAPAGPGWIQVVDRLRAGRAYHEEPAQPVPASRAR
jgi:hypothetical protein